MTVLFANNATSRIPADLPAGSTTITLMPGEGARFPLPTAGDIFMVTVEDRRTSQIEICRCTGRSGDILNVVRGQEGTAAQTFIMGASVANRMTAGTVTAFFGIPEAPEDHKPYAREDQTWVETITKIDFDDNNLAVEGELDALDVRVTATETKNTVQDGRLDAVEAVNTTQDTRLTNVENKNTAQDTRLTAIEAVNTSQDAAIATKIGDAPSDSKVYGRKNATWAEIVAGGGSAVHVGPNPPATPLSDQLWWDSNAGILSIYFDTTWVAVAGFTQSVTGIFTDDFNRPDGDLETSANWTRVGGTAGALQVISNHLRCNTSGADTAYQSPDQGSVDHYVQIKLLSLASLGGGGSFICCRLADANNYVGVRWTGSAWSIFRKEAGSYNSIATIATPVPVLNDIVKLQVVGTTYTLFLNGTSIGTGPIGSAGMTSTRTGLVARAATQDPWLDEFASAPTSIAVPPVFDFPSSPSNGQIYAPTNGPIYVYESPIWKIMPSTALVPTQDTAPSSPADGQLWWKSSNGVLYIWYEDGDSGQWVQASPSSGGSAGSVPWGKEFILNAATSGAPLPGQVRVNNASPVAVTSISVSKLTLANEDVGSLLRLAARGTKLVMQSKTNSGMFANYRVNGDVVDNFTYITFPVVALDIASGVPYSNMLLTFDAGIADAPEDGTYYVRQSANWVDVNTAINLKTARPKNYVVNSGFQVSQENAGNIGTTHAYYPADQWFASFLASGGAFSIQRLAGVAAGDSGGQHYLEVKATTAKPVLAAGDYLSVNQKLEGVQALGLNLWNYGATLIQFKVQTNTPGTYSVAIRNTPVNDATFVGQIVVPDATLRTYTIPVPAPTFGAWNTDTSPVLELCITLACGTTFTAPGTGWRSGNFIAASGQSNFLAVSGRYFRLFEVALYSDPDATGIAPKYQLPDFATSLRECMRYWNYLPSWIVEANTLALTTWYQVTMRVAPAIAGGGSGFTVAVPTPWSAQFFQSARAYQNLILNARM